MAEPLHPPAAASLDVPGDAQPSGRPPGDPGRSGGQPQGTGRLPPPPKVADQAGLPWIDTAPEPAGPTRWWSRQEWRQSSSFVASFLLHLVVLLALGLWAAASVPGSDSGWLLASTREPMPLEQPAGDYQAERLVVAPGRAEVETILPNTQYEAPTVTAPGHRSEDPTGTADSRPELLSVQPAESTDPMLRADTPVAGALRGRGREGRARLAAIDGNETSEAAVERGLRWLMAHQGTDGRWDFNHDNMCNGLCRNPGTESSTTAATGIALLPFLGAGYTHLEGEYQDVVRRGLYYLSRRAIVTDDGVDLQQGTMYAQGLATIALCEAYGMTRDPALKDLAQGALRFVVHAQDPKGGGWRYMPQQPGDTTVTGWQLMALKSGQMAGLEVPSPALFRVQRFLRSVESEGGARYGYQTPEPRNTTTAIGLLCRMYTGWRPSHPGLQKGVGYLSQWGPSDDNMYYDYYATQVMHHWGGAEWKAWNVRMRDHLIATQATTSHEAGSWYFGGGYGQVGGRVYNTAMAVMILEVYYRYLPLYRETVLEGEY